MFMLEYTNDKNVPQVPCESIIWVSIGVHLFGRHSWAYSCKWKF